MSAEDQDAIIFTHRIDLCGLSDPLPRRRTDLSGK
jgi:hypothetical protein